MTGETGCGAEDMGPVIALEKINRIYQTGATSVHAVRDLSLLGD